jgi:Family of unknown function (DUF6207)
VISGPSKNRQPSGCVASGMGAIEGHISGRGMVVVEVTAADEATARRAVEQLGQLWETCGPARVWRVPGEAGVHVRTYANASLRASLPATP